MTQKIKTTSSARTESKTVEVFNFNGFSLKTNSIYKVTPKLDLTAPNGYQENKTTKLPSEGIDNEICCRYIDTGNGQGLYDTGLYRDSHCFKGKTKEEKATIETIIKKHIVTPYEDLHNKQGLLDQSNHEFWENYLVSLYDDRLFNTEDVEDLLALYIALVGNDLTPVGQEGNPKYSHSQFMIKDAAQTMSIAQERTSDKFKAIGYFQQLLASDKEKLNNMLRSLSVVGLSDIPEDITLQVMFDSWLDRDVLSPTLFVESYDKVSTEEGYEEVILGNKVRKLINSRKLVKEGNMYYLDDTLLGTDMRNIVTNLLTNEELEPIREKIRLS